VLRSDGVLVHVGEQGLGQTQRIPGLPSGTSYVRVFAGRWHCFALRSDGELVAWGSNTWGECNVPPPPAGLNHARAAAGDDFSLGLLSNGVLVGWGHDTSGETQAPAPPPGLVYERVAAGDRHGLAWRSDGQVVGWGRTTSARPQHQRRERTGPTPRSTPRASTAPPCAAAERS